MGVYNLKCAITNKTIQHGDAVAVLLLIPKTFRDDSIMIYYNDAYDFATLPIFGRYDDYGGIEDIEPSDGLNDLMAHCKQDPHVSNIEDVINQHMQTFKLMHIKRDVYDYLMSDAFEKAMIDRVYPNMEKYYFEENIRYNRDTVAPVFEAMIKYKKQSLNDPDDIDLMVDIQDFSKLSMAGHLLKQDGLVIPRCLDLYEQSHQYIEFNGEFNLSIEDALRKHGQIQHLDNVLSTLGVKLVPTLYGSQDNDADFLWDEVYKKIPATIEDDY